MIAERVMPAPICQLEHHLLNLRRLRDEIDRQVDVRRRDLHSCPGPNRQVALRSELAERRRVRRQVAAAIDADEAALARFRLLTQGAAVPLGVLLAGLRSPTTQEGHD